MQRRIQKEVRPEHSGERLDRVLACLLPEFSRTHIQRLIASGMVRVAGRDVRPSHKVSEGERVEVNIPFPERLSIEPEAVPLDVFFEDDHLIVVNKPAGMVVHPAGPVRSGTMVNALLAHCDQLSGINGVLRPGIVHRLDKETSGLLVVAKDDHAHRGLAAQFEARSVERSYGAIVWGHPRADTGRVEGSIGRHRGDRKRMAVREEGGRHAATRFEVAEMYDFLALLTVTLETGRTHQIRVHMAHIGHPVFGDEVYGGRMRRVKGIAPAYRDEARKLLQFVGRQMLHAGSLGFVHPVSGDRCGFRAGPPEDMARVLARLRPAAEDGNP